MSGTAQDQDVRRVGTWHDDWPVAVVAAAGAGAVWVVATLAGVDVAVGSGSSSRDIGLVSVVVTAVVVAVAAGVLLRLLERRTARGRLTWTAIAVAVWVVSFAGPTGAASSSAALTLVALHLVVGAVVVVGLLRRHPERVA
jgi:hypothetical protein